jgi:hypothetical protein
LKKQRVYIAIVLAFALLLISCASNQKKRQDIEKQILLRDELARWESFRMTGICDIQYQAFSFRRPFVMTSHNGKFRCDVLDSGFLGLGSGIVMAAYIDGVDVQIRRPGSTAVEIYKVESEIFGWYELFARGWTEMLAEFFPTIISTYRCQIDDIELLFTDKMQISEIQNREAELKINFVYNRSGNLTDIKVSIPMIRNLTLQVDKVERFENDIKPLR